jgi:glutamine amidotransferase
MTAGRQPMRATFWLLDAPDSLADQSRRNPEGYGLGTYLPDGSPRVVKRPAAAYEDLEFAREAKEEESPTFVAHVRFASTGGLSVENTHPFEQKGRLFAHNGHIGDLEKLESQLGDYRDLVHGDTDSERFFALITRETDRSGGDLGAGIAAAARWVAAELPLYSLNCVVTTPTELFALRYPDTHALRVLERGAGGPSASRHLDAASPAGTVRVRSGDLVERPAVVVASEQMDEDPGWRMIEPGELLRVDGDLRVSSSVAVDAPAHQIRLDDLGPRAAASQQF